MIVDDEDDENFECGNMDLGWIGLEIEGIGRDEELLVVWRKEMISGIKKSGINLI